MAEKTITQLKKEIEELKSQIKAEKVEKNIPDNGFVSANEKAMNEPVTIKLFKDNGKYRDDVYVCVNDKSFLIRRGVEVTVPKYIEQALKNSLTQDEYVASMVERLVNDYEKSSENR